MRRRVRSEEYRARRYQNKAARRMRRLATADTPFSPETLRLAEEACKRHYNGTPEELVAAGVAFVMDTSLGGP